MSLPLTTQSGLDAWLAEFDPYGILSDPQALAQAERVEDLLQLRHRHHPSRLLDLGYYRTRYRVVVIDDFDWQTPVAHYESTDPTRILQWIQHALISYA